MSRRTYLTAHAVTVALTAATLPLALLLGCALGLALVAVPTERPWTAYAGAAAELGLLLAAAGGLGLLLAAGSSHRGRAASRLVALIVVLHLIDFFAPFWAPLTHVRWISPFHYFKPMAAFTPAGSRPALDAAVLLGVAAVSLALAYRRFEARDV